MVTGNVEQPVGRPRGVRAVLVDRRSVPPTVKYKVHLQPVGGAAPLNEEENRQLTTIRRFGTTGAMLLAAGSLGAGAAPVFNPLTTWPIIGLFARMPTVALASAFTGMAMIILSWLWLGRFVRPGRERLMSAGQIYRVMLTWVVPLVAVPPMFSRDVYSYLAQSKIAALGLNPYVLGPATALGVGDSLTRGVPTIWRDTPAPYGPLFITIGRGLSAITGDHVVTGVLLQRVLELIGVAMIVWALPRLARRFGVQPVSALWLGAANPLVLWHLIIGVHNEALMLGLMLAGLELALLRLPKVAPGDPVPPASRGELFWLTTGVVVITLGSVIKISALPALGFLGIMVAHRWGGRLRHVAVVGALFALLSGGVIVASSLGTGLGFGWISALGTNGIVRSWMSPVTDLGSMAGGIGLLFGLGNHTTAAITIIRFVGELATVVIIGKLLWDTYRGRMQPMIGLGLAMAAAVLLGATVQPWYLLWAALPLAVAVGESWFRTAATVISAFIAIVVPPTGSTFDGHAYVIPEAATAAAIVLILALLVIRHRIPVLPLSSLRRPGAVAAVLSGSHPPAR
ncbi:MAG TPA: polyprenol phosphomannose-dependent alpha 1,6 mannosyltransferase MptB [Pseudonocardiaceae bacterium]